MEKKNFSHEQLQEALFYIENVLDRSLVPFVVLEDLAQQIKSTDLPQLNAEYVKVGIMKRHLTESAKSIMRIYLDRECPTLDQKTIKFNYKEVPIIVKVIKNHYPFFEHPDTKFYQATQFRLPNPFMDYWVVRKTLV